MKKFLKKAIIYLIPFLIYFIMVVIVDPFNYFNVSHFIDNKIKKNTSYRLHYQLWKLIEYERDPLPNIILGDSRALYIKPREIYKFSNEKYFNFAYGGGTLSEIIDTFWYCTKKVKLKNVYIDINFNRYNAIETRNRFVNAKNITQNFLGYAFNKTTFLALYYNLRGKFVNKNFRIGKPKFDKEKFWQKKLHETAKYFYSKYVYPEKYHTELKKIASYCKKNNIKLVFFIPPIHVDLQNFIKKYELEEKNKQFKMDLAELGEVFDFNVDNKLTENVDNFVDPLHVDDQNGVIVPEVWGNQIHYSRLIIGKSTFSKKFQVKN